VPWRGCRRLRHFISFLQTTRMLSNIGVGIATGYGLDDPGVRVRVPVGSELSLFHVVQTGSGTHPASSSMCSGGSLLGGNAAGVWS
jgi:hypothetical protein